MGKIYLFDTNVLLYGVNAILNFPKETIAIPILEQIDHFKRKFNDLGKNARLVTQLLNEFCCDSSLTMGKRVFLKNGGNLKALGSLGSNNRQISNDVTENDFLLHALNLKNRGVDVVIISKKLSIRLWADSLDISSQDYFINFFSETFIYKAYREFEFTQDEVDKFRTSKIATRILFQKGEESWFEEEGLLQ